MKNEPIITEDFIFTFKNKDGFRSRFLHSFVYTSPGDLIEKAMKLHPDMEFISFGEANPEPLTDTGII